MEITITGHNLQVTADIQKYAERKLGKLGRYLPNLIETKVDLVEEKTKSKQQRFLVRLVLVSSIGVLHGEERAADVMQAIDKAATTMSHQLEHYKGKLYEKRGTSLSQALQEEEEDEAPPEAPTGTVVKVKRFQIKPMTVEEALEEMVLLGHDFFLFFNDDVKEFRLVYRRKDGDFGLIEPELG